MRFLFLFNLKNLKLNLDNLLRQGKKIKEIAKELERNPSTIYRWLWGGRKAKNKLRN